MIQYFLNKEGHIVEMANAKDGAWVNVVPPFKEEEFIDLSENLEIPIEFLRDSLDIDERARYEQEDNTKFIVIKTPTENNSFNESDAYYITIPICIILTHQQIVTVNSFDNGAIKKFLNSFQNRHPDKKNMMVLKIFEKVVQNFMEYLREINQKTNQYEQQLYESNKNSDLFNLMRIQKSLVYFITSLKANELLLMKLSRSNFLKLNEDEREYLEDLLVDLSQASEMANIYSNILTSTMDAFASIINNNMNTVMKRLTSITLIISIPTLVSSAYGMNVEIPGQHSFHAFYIPVIISLLISVVICWYFWKKKWF
ncbi:magnesium transporter CorA family protein [Rhizosphaericola mali]|uniref:Magnesium transporter CorA family protein n=1 Tax=Rhizosphaericola mali TaxID=2545455 RepID=A0A5P2FY68_9BACT|nr:magnesium transporter CorA family protein [Rhizosphaericola mali]QES87887.1 magnesium transporter CorA family protein [Rhizosphaericola mali]